MYNPYAAPESEVNDGSRKAPGARVEDECLVVISPFSFGDQCPLCGDQACTRPKEENVYYASPYIYLLVLLNMLIMLVVYMIVRKKLDLTYGLCQLHEARRRKFSLCGWIAFILCLVAGVAAFAMNQYEAILAIPVILVVLIVLHFAIGNRAIAVKKYHDGEFHLKNIGQKILNQYQ